MKAVLHAIELQKQWLSQHPFFAERARAGSLPELLSFAPRLAFWVGVFQDVLRINAGRTSDPELAQLVRQHAREEGGHDTWYYEDIELLTGRPLEAQSVAAASSFPTRKMAYLLWEEAASLELDWKRLVFLVTLEATSEVFFSTLLPLVERHGGGKQLRYFGTRHLDSEHSHTMFERTVMERLSAIELNDEERLQGLALVHRTFATFEDFFDALRSRGAEDTAWVQTPLVVGG